jgi:hypothetical protein
MEKGDTQTITIRPGDVSSGGAFTLTRALNGVTPGSFVISSTVLAQANQDDCRHVVTEETTEWGDWHKDKDGTQWREGTVYKITRCVDGNNNKVLKKEEIGKAREVKKKDGSSTVTKRTKGDKGDTVTQEEKDKNGNVKKTTTAQYDESGKVKGVTENKGGKTTEWKKEGDKWYRKKGDAWVEDKGPETIPELK